MARWLHGRGSALAERLVEARAPQRDLEARRLKARARAALFGGKRRTTVARYHLHEVLGRGGAGVVYRARDPELDRPVAIKVVRPENTSEAALADLVCEARAIAALAHPNVVAVYDTGRVDDDVYIAMELVEGESLDAWLRAERSWPEIRDVLVQAGRGLAHAHAAGIVHRDFKPGNVIVGLAAQGVSVKVVDFGLAKHSTPDADPPGRNDAYAGTPAYMAPEQALGRPADARADQFAFCVVAYEALHGRRPFTGRSRDELARKLDAGEIEDGPAVVAAPARVQRAIRRGLSRLPHGRWPDMASLLAELERSPRRPSWVAVPVVAAGAAWLAWYDDVSTPACEVGAGQIEQAWGPDRAAELVSSIAAAPELARAAGQWPRVEAELDAYGERWSSAYAGACSAPAAAADPHLHQRIRCLEHRLTMLAAFVDLLEAADARVIATALEAVRSLPPVETCLQGAPLENLFPTATSPEQLAGYARIDERLAEASARLLLGQHELAIVPLREAVADADLVGSRSLAARALHLLGAATRGSGDFDAAADHTMAAFWHAMASSSDDTAADSAILLVAILGHDLGQFEEADRWARQAGALLPRVSDPVLGEFELELARGQAMFAAHHDERAQAHLLRALELAGELPEGRVGVGVLYLNLASVNSARGESAAAFDYQRRAREALERELGPIHPEVANARANFALMLLAQDRRQEAVEELEASIAAAEVVGSGEHPMVGMAHNNLGLVLLQLGRFEDARIHLDRALAIVSDAMPPTHPYLGMVYGNLGQLAAETGDPEAAREALGRAAVILGEALGPGDPMLAKLTKMRGDVERGAGNEQLAVALYEQTLDLLAGVSGHDETRAAAEAGLSQLQRALAEG